MLDESKDPKQARGQSHLQNANAEDRVTRKMWRRRYYIDAGYFVYITVILIIFTNVDPKQHDALRFPGFWVLLGLGIVVATALRWWDEEQRLKSKKEEGIVMREKKVINDDMKNHLTELRAQLGYLQYQVAQVERTLSEDGDFASIDVAGPAKEVNEHIEALKRLKHEVADNDRIHAEPEKE